ncbi:MAG: primosomal replication protein N [Ideonella sp.]|nr:primosomal replication protein N [Ideonella sp.]MCC7459500.1 primosomal replication protein N [Nitrospira sp.]
MNRLLLSARLVERGALRYTPAGLPALDFKLEHRSEASEDNQVRKVSLQIRAVAIGAITQALAALALGDSGTFGGFVAGTRNGRGLLFHVTSLG